MHIIRSDIVTRADDSCRSKAFIGVCLCVCVHLHVCVCVCLHDRTKTAETTINKLATGIVVSPGYLFNIRLKGQRSQVTKCQNIFQAIKWLV